VGKRGRPIAELPEAFALAEQGMTAHEIARAVGVCAQTVKAWARRNGVTLAQHVRTKHPATERALAFALGGMHVAEIARQIGVSHLTVDRMLARNDVTPGSCKGLAAVSPQNVARREKMVSMYRQGLTLKKIGLHFGVTRERVRQVLKTAGVTGVDGGRTKVKASKQQAVQAKRDARAMARWGLAYAEMKARRADRTLYAFVQQRNSAAARGIGWSLTFSQWFAVWLESGKLEHRGRGKGRYVMSRLQDSGGYEVGNVHIQLSTENNADAVPGWVGKTKANRGVHYLYPGLQTPWAVKVCKKQIGLYQTEEEAVAARLAYVAANGMRIGRSGCVLPSRVA
jgi:transposase